MSPLVADFVVEVGLEWRVGWADDLLSRGKASVSRQPDSEAEPMCYRETGAMDGAFNLYPDVFGES
jgi:hypothetical protein